MARVVIYTAMFCPFCSRARKLLDAKGVAYEEIDTTARADLRAEMTERSGGRRTVPQILVDGDPIGGFDELDALERSGELSGRLGLGA